jgi:NTP pyrophosphatase (non-canonical NTP hydrolase)
MLKVLDYQNLARTTALYKAYVNYPLLGLAGETGEIAEKVKKILRDKEGIVSEEDKLELKKELGDVLWYLSNLSYDLSVDLSLVARRQYFEERGNPYDYLPDNVFHLYRCAGRLVEYVYQTTENDTFEIEKYKGLAFHVFYAICELAMSLGLKMEDVAQANLDKLKSRQERGVLQGSGDNR